MRKIVVGGSLNMDLSVRVEHIPKPGETILGGDLLQSPGGKGANQAYAAAKLAKQQGVVRMLGCVGRDDFGSTMIQNLESVGCNGSGIHQVPGPSGVALIVVSTQGENAIVVAPGANALFTPNLVEDASRLLTGAAALLLQLEVPIDTVLTLARAAKACGVRVILDPAPAPKSLPPELLTLADILTPNEGEAMALSGIDDQPMTPELANRIADQLSKQGCGSVILKLGARGCLIHEKGQSTFIPAPEVDAVDTTAAGDIFNGALAVSLAEGASLREACLFAIQAASLSVTKKGAQLSTPSREEVQRLIALQG